MNAFIKILILGASSDQVKLITAAKQLGYYVIDCDFTSNNPGLSLVDKHYQVSYLDREEVLKIARREKINGIISNSEQAMPVVAYVSEKLSLPGNSVNSIITLADKTKFRKLQTEVGIFSPKHYEVNTCEDAINRIGEMELPVLIKPCECSASRGTFKVDRYDGDDIKKFFLESSRLSWNRKVAIEEFVSMPSLTTYEGDIFVLEDNIIWEGIFYTQRSAKAPMIPMTYSGPLNINDKFVDSIKEIFRKIFKAAGIKLGQYNVEFYLTDRNKLFVIEINTRQGGRNLPEFINRFSGIDLTKLLVSTCVGERRFFEEYKNGSYGVKYISHHLLFPHRDGKFSDLYISPVINDFVTFKEIYVEYGCELHESYNGTDMIGYVDFEFPSEEIRNRYAFDLEKYVCIEYV